MVVLSNEAQEIIRVCDRALVLYHGDIQAEVKGRNHERTRNDAAGNRRLNAGERRKQAMTQVTNRQTLLEKVGRKWKSDPIFSTGLVLALMVILQTVALGFDYESFGAWFTNWGKNWINILRNNAGVGIVALGMTFVIISAASTWLSAPRWLPSARLSWSYQPVSDGLRPPCGITACRPMPSASSRA